jgi:hypothetical protein
MEKYIPFLITRSLGFDFIKYEAKIKQSVPCLPVRCWRRFKNMLQIKITIKVL